jgi:hypothetical protein
VAQEGPKDEFIEFAGTAAPASCSDDRCTWIVEGPMTVTANFVKKAAT